MSQRGTSASRRRELRSAHDGTSDLRRPVGPCGPPPRRAGVPRLPRRGRCRRLVDVCRVRRGRRPRRRVPAGPGCRRRTGRAPRPAQLAGVRRPVARHEPAGWVDRPGRPRLRAARPRGADPPHGTGSHRLRRCAPGGRGRRVWRVRAPGPRAVRDRSRPGAGVPADPGHVLGLGAADGRPGARGPARRHVHLRHDVRAQGCGAHPGQLPPRGPGHGRARRPRCRGPLVCLPAAVPRQRPVLLRRVSDRRRRIGGSHRPVHREPMAA